MTTLAAFFDTAAKPETAKEPHQETCDICGQMRACRDLQGTPVCEECGGPAPDPITRADVVRVLSAFDKLSITALLAMALIGAAWLT